MYSNGKIVSLHLLAAREWRLEVVRVKIFAGDHMLESHSTAALDRLSSFTRHGPIALLHLHYAGTARDVIEMKS